MSNKRNVAVGTLLVAAAGYVAGLLTAPKSGRETRKDIRNAALKAKSEGERKLKAAHSELNALLAEASLKASKTRTKATEELGKARVKAETIRDKTKVLLSAIHEGEAEDDDLNIALQDVKAAIKHLKQYVSKPEAKKQ